METKRKTIILFSLLFIFLFLNLDVSPAFATEIFSDGFESGDFSNWTATATNGGTISVVTEQAYQGTYSCKATRDGSNNGEYARVRKDLGANYKTVYYRQYVRVTTLPDANNKRIIIARLYDTQDFEFRDYVMIRHDGTSAKWYLGGGGSASYGSTVNANQWYCIEMGRHYAASGGWLKLWVDGNLDIEITGLTDDETCGRIFAGIVGSDYVSPWATTLYTDCVVVADTYIGPISEEQEYSYTFTETLKPSTSLNQWQEHASIFTQTLTLTSTLNYGAEATYVFTQTITPSETVTYYQEHSYAFTQPLTLTETLNYAKELAETFITNIETLTPKTIVYVILPEAAEEINTALVLAAFAATIAIVALSLTITKKD